MAALVRSSGSLLKLDASTSSTGRAVPENHNERRANQE